MSSIKITASNVKQFDNYVLYRIWQEATTKKERSLAMKEIKRRQSEGNMSNGHPTHYTVTFDSASWKRGLGIRKERQARTFKNMDDVNSFIDFMQQRNSESDIGQPYFTNVTLSGHSKGKTSMSATKLF